jgi:hypothetical protein
MSEPTLAGLQRPLFQKVLSRVVLVVIAGVLAFGLVNLIAHSSYPAGTCPAFVPTPSGLKLDPPGSPQPLPDWSFVVVGIVAVVIGSFLGRARPHAAELTGHPHTQARVLAPLLATLLLFLVTFALAYEAAGVAHAEYQSVGEKTIAQPITYYVRCAIFYDFYPDFNPTQPTTATRHMPWATYALVAGFCMLLGNWLWWPPFGSRPSGAGVLISPVGSAPAAAAAASPPTEGA